MIEDRALAIAPDAGAAVANAAGPTADVADPGGHVSYSSLSMYDACPTRYAVRMRRTCAPARAVHSTAMKADQSLRISAGNRLDNLSSYSASTLST